MISPSLLIVHAVLALRALFELDPGEALEHARVDVRGHEFWLVRGDEPPAAPWREAQADDVVTYRVLVEPGLEAEIRDFVELVDRTLTDPDGWGAAGRSFVRVDSRAAMSIVLAQPSTVDKLCKPLRTRGRYSCGRGGRAMLNLGRWQVGSLAWTATLLEYRTYMVNHEVGHLLGMPHLDCPAAGEPAPIMQQQTFGLDGCLPSSRPSTGELERLRRRWSK